MWELLEGTTDISKFLSIRREGLQFRQKQFGQKQGG